VSAAVLLLLTAAVAAAQTGQVRAPSREDEVVAVIGEEVIRLGDLKRYWRTQDPMSFTRVEQQTYEAEKRALEGLIVERVLRNEAKKQGVPVDDLLARRLPALIAPVTEADIKQIYERSPAANSGVTLDQARLSITTYLQKQRLNEARLRYADDLRKASAGDVVVRLQAPREAVKVATRNPTVGPVSAPVEIVEFADFECSFCKQTAPLLGRLVTKYGDRVRLVWKDMPLSGHSSALPAAEAAACAHDQGKFWAYHDTLFANQPALAPADLSRYAVLAGLDISAFRQCVDSARHRSDVMADAQEAKLHGVSATPTVFINGRRVLGGRPLEAYEQIIDEELAAMKPVTPGRATSGGK
jgi:protein-disulfide isomerase